MGTKRGVFDIDLIKAFCAGKEIGAEENERGDHKRNKQVIAYYPNGNEVKWTATHQLGETGEKENRDQGRMSVRGLVICKSKEREKRK